MEAADEKALQREEADESSASRVGAMAEVEWEERCDGRRGGGERGEG